VAPARFSSGEGWTLWPWIAVRTAGVPASLALAVASPESAAMARRIAEAEDDARRTAIDGLREELATEDGKPRGRRLAALERLEREEVPSPPTSQEIAGSSALRELAAALKPISSERALLAKSIEREGEIERRALLEGIRDPRVRQAMVWQNRGAVHGGIDWLLRRADGASNSERRREERKAVLYLQRYALKNDTIGAFGPVAFARIAPHARGLDVKAGPGLVARRETYFEGWCIDQLAATFSERPQVGPWLAPRLLPYFRLEGATLHVPGRAPIELPPAQARALALCDGTRSANAIARELVAADPGSYADEERALQALATARDMGLLRWAIDLPTELHPERTLRDELSTIADVGARQACVADLDALEAARGEVARSVGDAERLDSALANVDAVFERVTQASATRNAGRTLAGRTLLYEDASRDVEVTVGAAILDRLRDPLGLLFVSAQWFTSEIARRYRSALLDLHAEIVATGAGEVVDLAVFHPAMMKVEALNGAERPPDAMLAVQAEHQRRWADILAPPAGAREVRRSSASLRDAVKRAFPSKGPGWWSAVHVAPDVMIGAKTDGHAARGDVEIVIGEMHLAHTLVNPFFETFHPDPRESLALMDEDRPPPVVVPVLPKAWFTSRLNLALIPSHSYRYEFDHEVSGAPRERVLRIGDLVVERRGETLLVRTRDDRVRFDVIDFLGAYLTALGAALFSVLPPAAHAPRVVIDDVVVAREQWAVRPDQLGIIKARDAVDRAVLVQGWARAHDIPRFVFVRIPGERKPFFVDLASITYVEAFAKLAAQSGRTNPDAMISVAEMVPGPDEIWFPDASGERYTCELRIIATAPGPPAFPTAGSP